MKNPVAEAFGQKLRKIREVRGQSRTEAAKQLGFELGYYQNVENGDYFPSREAVNRIYNWAFVGWHYSSSRLKLCNQKRASRKRERTIGISKAVYDGILQESKNLGVPMDAVANLLLARALINKPAFVTLKDAIEALQKEEGLEFVRSAPESKEVLRADLDRVVKVEDLKPIEDRPETSLQKIIDADIQKIVPLKDMQWAKLDVEPLE